MKRVPRTKLWAQLPAPKLVLWTRLLRCCWNYVWKPEGKSEIPFFFWIYEGAFEENSLLCQSVRPFVSASQKFWLRALELRYVALSPPPHPLPFSTLFVKSSSSFWIFFPNFLKANLSHLNQVSRFPSLPNTRLALYSEIHKNCCFVLDSEFQFWCVTSYQETFFFNFFP